MRQFTYRRVFRLNQQIISAFIYISNKLHARYREIVLLFMFKIIKIYLKFDRRVLYIFHKVKNPVIMMKRMVIVNFVRILIGISLYR